MNDTNQPRLLSCLIGLIFKLTTVCLITDTHLCLAGQSIKRDPRSEVIYFLLVDRFADGDKSNNRGDLMLAEKGLGRLSAGPMIHGYDPTAEQFYHGGDLAGIISKLKSGYFTNLGITAIWLSPVFKNLPVRLTGREKGRAGYHGYWTIDFTQIDPHFGTNEEYKKLVEVAHSMGIKVYQDIVVNHTADIIQYKQCHDKDYKGPGKIYGGECPFLESSLLETPYSRRIRGLAHTSEQTRIEQGSPTRFAYTPFIPEHLKAIKKVPEWLNDVTLYHNRGEGTGDGESLVYGDFFGLDDLATEDPLVRAGFIDIYSKFIKDYRVDGFRLDTVKHVEIEFWKVFGVAIKEAAKSVGIDNFFLFGEVFGSRAAENNLYLTKGGLDGILDFPFRNVALQVATQADSSGKQRPPKLLYDLFLQDDYYNNNNSSTDSSYLPTFISNHDIGRIGGSIQDSSLRFSETQKIKASFLAHALMIFSRGIPVIYYGDEQGFCGRGLTDGMYREDMFPGQVEGINGFELIGTDKRASDDNFDQRHPIYRSIARATKVYQDHPTLQTGIQLPLFAEPKGGGIYAFKRIDMKEQVEYLVLFNTHHKDAINKTIPSLTKRYELIFSSQPIAPKNLFTSAGQVAVEIQPLSVLIYKGTRKLESKIEQFDFVFQNSDEIAVINRARFINIDVDKEGLFQVDFYAYSGQEKEEPVHIGRDLTPPYRIFFNPISSNRQGEQITIEARVTDQISGKSVTKKIQSILDLDPIKIGLLYENHHNRTHAFIIGEDGQIVFYPKPLESNRIEFSWPAGASKVYVIFESSEEFSNLAYDHPVEISFDSAIAPLIQVNRDQVDIQLSTAPPLAPPSTRPWQGKELFIRGGINEWDTRNKLDYVGGGVYETKVYLPNDRVEFKFADASWAVANIGGPFTPDGLNVDVDPMNLAVKVPHEGMGLYQVNLITYKTKGENIGVFYRFSPITTPYPQQLSLTGDFKAAINFDVDYTFQYLGEGRYSLEGPIIASEDGCDLRVTDIMGARMVDLGEQISSLKDDPVFSPEANFDHRFALEPSGPDILLCLKTGLYRFTLDAADLNQPYLRIESTGPWQPGKFSGNLFIQGEMSGWQKSNNTQLIHIGDEVYEAKIFLEANTYEFKVSDGSWLKVNLGIAWHIDNKIVCDQEKLLFQHPFSRNLVLKIDEDGEYTFRVDMSDSESPYLVLNCPT